MKKYIASIKVVGVDDTEDGAIEELMFQLGELERRLGFESDIPSEVNVREIDEEP